MALTRRVDSRIDREMAQQCCTCIPRKRYIASFGVSARRIANMHLAVREIERCAFERCPFNGREMFATRKLYHIERRW